MKGRERKGGGSEDFSNEKTVSKKLPAWETPGGGHVAKGDRSRDKEKVFERKSGGGRQKEDDLPLGKAFLRETDNGNPFSWHAKRRKGRGEGQCWEFNKIERERK